MNTSKMNELKETLNKAMELATELKNEVAAECFAKVFDTLSEAHRFISVINLTSKRYERKLVVLDYSDSSVNVYSDIPDIDDTEKLLRHYGHKSNQCSWMFCESCDINIH